MIAIHHRYEQYFPHYNFSPQYFKWSYEVYSCTTVGKFYHFEVENSLDKTQVQDSMS